MYLGPSVESQTIVSPQLILTSEILQLSGADLEQRISQELTDNPALERLESFHCLRCGAPVPEGQRLCVYCSRQPEGRVAYQGGQYDMESWVPEKITLEQYLLAQLRLLLPDRLCPVAELVIGYLDGHGFLTLSVDELAERHSLPVRDVARVVLALRGIEPAGIGARDAHEALLIQIDHLEGDGPGPELALTRRILGEHWPLFKQGEGTWAEIAEAEGVGIGAVREAVGFIIRNLNPFPAQAWWEGDRSALSPVGDPVQPDALLYAVPCASGYRFEVEVLDQYRFPLRINEWYGELVRGGVEQADQDDIEAARYYVDQARLFLHGLRQRWDTLRRVSLTLAEAQREFVFRGPRYLQPMTRAQLAVMLQVHESTISRAVAYKYIQLPDQRVVPLSDFFDGSLPAKHDLQALIVQEDKVHPLSDQILVHKLRDLGHDVARRTVTKYRRALGIPSSRLRYLAAQCRDAAQQSALSR